MRWLLNMGMAAALLGGAVVGIELTRALDEATAEERAAAAGEAALKARLEAHYDGHPTAKWRYRPAD